MSLQSIKRRRTAIAFILTVFVLAFMAVPLVYSLGDLGVVVEELKNPKADKCPYCGRAIVPGIMHTDAANIVKEKLKTALTDRNIGYSDGIKKGQMYVNVLIYRFQERKGGNFAADKPASVSFHMHLMKDGVVGKIFPYSEEQKALTQNLFTMGKFLKRGARWVTADELAEEGINTGLDNLIGDMQETGSGK
ncbi:MAG: hypothetical protein ACYDHW_03340 [Syntrophorhabdaceae bacterium]